MSGRVIGSSMALVAGVLLGVNTAAAQSPPPIGGVTGTIATEGSMKAFYRGAKEIIVTTADGIDHVFRFAKDLIVHGGKHPGPDALAGLREGTTVVVHYTTNGAGLAAREIDVIGPEGLQTTEGTVIRLDRRHQQITVRHDDGKTETFRLSDRAVAEATAAAEPAAASSRVVIYYTDENGHRIAHFFKKIS